MLSPLKLFLTIPLGVLPDMEYTTSAGDEIPLPAKSVTSRMAFSTKRDSHMIGDLVSKTWKVFDDTIDPIESGTFL